MTLSQFIKTYREEQGLSQRQLAIQCGLSNGYISMLEKEMNHHTGTPVAPSIRQLKKLATGMHMTLTDLMVAVDDIPVSLIDEDKMTTLKTEGGLTGEIADVILKMNDAQQAELLQFAQFLLSKTADKK